MKIIHTADQHLDSKMESNLSKEKAKERKAEIRKTFVKMVDYAVEKEVSAILLAGDLFDKKIVSRTDQEVVKNVIFTHPNIDFYYLRGNHDDNCFLAELGDIPDNLKLFDNSFKSYEIENSNVVITGAELNNGNSKGLFNTLSLNMDKFNIVMLHGQENIYESKDKTEVVSIKELKNKGIDYLALGHVHEHREGRIDSRGIYAYSGCLEGRGYDECGEHGFILLDINDEKKTFTHEFIPFAYRKLFLVDADISGLESVADIEDKVKNAISDVNISEKDFVKVVLSGKVSVDANIDTDYLEKAFSDDYYALKVKNETKIVVDYETYAKDQSLKGEFVRSVKNSELSEEEKARVIKMGIGLLQGDKI